MDTQEYDSQIAQMNKEGIHNLRISEILGIDRKFVGRRVTALGLRSRRSKRTNIIDVGNGMVECTKCGRHLPREDLPWGRVTNSPYQLSYCRSCLTQSMVNNVKSSTPKYLNHRMRALRHRCKNNGTPFDLPPGYLYDLYQQQDGKCFYTDIPLEIYFGTKKSGARDDSLSVDKIIPESGYIVGNVVLCASRINTMKLNCSLEEMARWMPEWHRRIVEYLNR